MELYVTYTDGGRVLEGLKGELYTACTDGGKVFHEQLEGTALFCTTYTGSCRELDGKNYKINALWGWQFPL